jgi:Tectonin domain
MAVRSFASRCILLIVINMLAVVVSRPQSSKPGSDFQQVAGAGTDVGVGADGSVFVIGTAPCDGNGCGIYRFDGTTFQKIEGSAVRIAVDPTGHPWVVNRSGGIWRLVNGHFQQVAGAATDVGVGADGSVFVIGTAPCDGNGCGIYRFDGTTFQKIEGSALGIAVGPAGNPWVVNRHQGIFRTEVKPITAATASAAVVSTAAHDSFPTADCSPQQVPGKHGTLNIYRVPFNGDGQGNGISHSIWVNFTMFDDGRIEAPLKYDNDSKESFCGGVHIRLGDISNNWIAEFYSDPNQCVDGRPLISLSGGPVDKHVSWNLRTTPEVACRYAHLYIVPNTDHAASSPTLTGPSPCSIAPNPNYACKLGTGSLEPAVFGDNGCSSGQCAPGFHPVCSPARCEPENERSLASACGCVHD